jgi:hypothetical protein
MLLSGIPTKKTNKKTTTIKYTSSSSYPQLFPIRPGMAQVFIRQYTVFFTPVSQMDVYGLS